MFKILLTLALSINSISLFACNADEEFISSTKMKLQCDKTFPGLSFALKDRRGLVWGIIYDKDMNLVKKNWQDANITCNKIGLRLPSNEEWKLIYDILGSSYTSNCRYRSRRCYKPLDTFPKLKRNSFWSSSKTLEGPYFFKGEYGSLSHIMTSAYPLGVMCISGSSE